MDVQLCEVNISMPNQLWTLAQCVCTLWNTKLKVPDTFPAWSTCCWTLGPFMAVKSLLQQLPLFWGGIPQDSETYWNLPQNHQWGRTLMLVWLTVRFARSDWRLPVQSQCKTLPIQLKKTKTCETVKPLHRKHIINAQSLISASKIKCYKKEAMSLRCYCTYKAPFIKI